MCIEYIIILQNISMENRKEYFKYFNSRANYTEADYEEFDEENVHQFNKSTTQYELPQKVLPHISEQYQYRMTNQLLSEKIKNPKRDKLIIESNTFERSPTRQSTKNRFRTHKSKQNISHKKSEQKVQNKKPGQYSKHTSSKKRKPIKNHVDFHDRNTSWNNSQKQHALNVENKRIGNKLLNAQSRIRELLTSNYYTFQLYNGSITNKDHFVHTKKQKTSKNGAGTGMLNQGILYFYENQQTQHKNQVKRNQSQKRYRIFNKTLKKCTSIENNHTCQQNHSLSQSHEYVINNPQRLTVKGKGRIHFIIQSLILISNPPVKSDILLKIQVIQRDSELSRIANRYYQSHNFWPQASCHTEYRPQKNRSLENQFTYSELSSQENTNFGLHFRINRRKNIYLRLSKIENLAQLQLGMVELDLTPFLTHSKLQKHKKKIKGCDVHRQVFISEFQGYLQRLKFGQTGTLLKIKYKMFENKYICLNTDTVVNKKMQNYHVNLSPTCFDSQKNGIESVQ